LFQMCLSYSDFTVTPAILPSHVGTCYIPICRCLDSEDRDRILSIMEPQGPHPEFDKRIQVFRVSVPTGSAVHPMTSPTQA
jgi:hypothetical protein